MANKFIPNEDDKQKALVHIFHEIKSYFNAFLLISDFASIVVKDKQNNEINYISTDIKLDYFLLHSRVLIDFFIDKNPRYKDDIISSDFGFHDNEFIISPDTLNNINKRLPHLTYERNLSYGSTFIWQGDLINFPLLKACSKFLEHLIIKYHLDAKWVEIYNQIKHFVTQLPQ